MKFFWLVGNGVALAAAGISLMGCASRTSAVANAAPATDLALPAPSASVSALPAAAAAPTAEKMCGGIAGFRCDGGQYCSFPLSARCGAGDMAGVCKPISDMCTMEFAPVCGCDGKTYATACVAGRSGVSVASNGACAGDEHSGSALADGALCGTRGVRGECGASSYCAYKSQCGGTDSGGVCTKRPEMCNDLFAAVCGCDGKSYPNACHAQRQGVSVAATGACQPN